MNAGIQGLAADIFKVAIVNLDKVLEDEGLESSIVLQVTTRSSSRPPTPRSSRPAS